MKPRIFTTAAVMGLFAAISAGELLAAGSGYGGGRGQGNGAGIGMKQQTQAQSQVRTQTRTHAQSQTQSQTQATNETMSTTRPADSQRRDGTFLTTGTTANGSTTRPGYGRGLQDGSRLNTNTSPDPTAPQ
jgi:membrane protease subunit (stomatin/prohibitin family)